MRLFTKALATVASAAVLVGIGVSPAQAATDYNITETNGTAHARGWGSIDWKSWNSFNIPRAHLRDLACDDQPVFWYVDVDGRWAGTKRFHHGGCNSEASWDDVHASDIEGIRSIAIYVCRDTLFPECDHKSFSNPHSR